MCDEYHVCPFCSKTLPNRYEPKPRTTEVDEMNGETYMKCPHCHGWWHSASDCCPHCNAPYCGGM